MKISFVICGLILVFAISSQAEVGTLPPSTSICRLSLGVNSSDILKLFNPFSPASYFFYTNLRVLPRLGSLRKMTEFSRAIVRAHQIMEPQGFLVVFSSKVAEVLRDKTFDRRLHTFWDALQKEKEAVSTGKVSSKNVWDLALDANGGDVDKSLDFMMLFVQDNTSSREVVHALRRRGVEFANEIWVDIQAVRTAIGNITNSLASLDPSMNFATPNFDGAPSPFQQLHHFWSAAYIAKELRFSGFSPEMASFAAMTNGDTYEKAFYPAYLVLGSELGPESWKIQHPLNHIAAHIRGALFGANPDIHKLPSQKEVVTFVKRNFWNHYRAIAYGEFGKEKVEESIGDGKIRSLIRELNREKFTLLLSTLILMFLN